MNQAISDLDPRPDDLVVIPDDMVVLDEALPFMVHRVKFLNKPSIIRSGSYGMGFLSSISTKPFKDWLSQFAPDFSFLGSMGKATDEDGPVTLAKGQIIYEKPELPTFYRHVRMIEEIDNGPLYSSWRQSAKGGVTFLVELDPANKTFAFSYALCSTEENFCKDTGRAIAKAKFEAEDWYEVDNYDGQIGVVENIREAIKLLLSEENRGTVDPAVKPIHFSSISEKMKLRELKQILERI
jgi:hypothetical protein